MNYYYLAAALPEIRIGSPLDISFEDLEILMRENLNSRDWEKVRTARRFYDIENIRALWRHEPFNKYGNDYSVPLEEQLITLIGLPEYIIDFVSRYDNVESRLRHFLELIANYFRAEIEKAESFLRQYLIFEREWRLVFAAFRAKKLGRDITSELQFESPYDDLVMQIIAQKDSKTYTPPYSHSELKPIFDSYQDQPLELHKALCEYRFAKVEELLGVDLFSIDRVLGYMVQLIIAEQWQELDKEKGIEVVDTIIKEAS